MNLKRAIGGPILSIIFLIFFAYMIASVQFIFDNYLQNQNKGVFLGSVSGGVQNATTTENAVQPATTENSAPEINAKSAISIESNLQRPGGSPNKIILEKDSDVQLPIASLTKLMTAVVALDNYNLSDTVVVDKNADSQDSMKEDVKLGDIMSVESFLDIMLIESSNKSAYALSEGPGGYPGEEKFVGLMNQKAKDLGLENTFFVDPTGLSSGDVSTASDLAKLAEYILKNYPKIAEISKAKELYVPKFGYVENTDQLLGEIPDIICSKTGFTNEANGCLLLVINNPTNNDYLINVVLGADNRFSEMEKLINWSSVICK